MKRITIKDIASHTGFSINTVSRALRGSENVSPKTKEIIDAYAEEVGYIADNNAKTLRVKHNNVIAIIMENILEPYNAALIDELETIFSSFNYNIMIFNSNSDEEKELKAIKHALGYNISGIIIYPVQNSLRNIQFLNKTKIPFVVLERQFQDVDISVVSRDNTRGGFLAAEILLSMGHKNIIVINGPQNKFDSILRFDGIRSAFMFYGAVFNEKMLYHIPNKIQEYDEIISSIIEENDNNFSGVICFNDTIALNVIQKLQQKGLSVPEDVSVVGFDNIQENITLPTELTTIYTPQNKLSLAAAELLFDKIQNIDNDNTVILPVEIIVRKTTGYAK